MKFIKKTLIIFFLLTTYVKAQEVTTWLQSEVDNILNSYKNSSLSNLERFNIVEKTVNSNFAGAGIAKFVAGKAWASANEDLKKEYIKLFKKHLALNIASMMQGYADQSYNLIKTEIDESNQLILIDMEILDQNNSFVVTWRIKESKGRFFVIDLIKDLIFSSFSNCADFLYSILHVLTIIKESKSSFIFLLLYPIEYKASVLALSKNFK